MPEPDAGIPTADHAPSMRPPAGAARATERRARRAAGAGRRRITFGAELFVALAVLAPLLHFFAHPPTS